MPSKSNLSPVRITRADGVATTVWRKDDTAPGKSRILSGKAPAVAAPPVRSGHPVDFAMEFDTENLPDVVEPEWWNEYVADSQKTDVGFESTPELLDVIPSPIGDIAVVWQPTSHDEIDTTLRNSGFESSGLYLISAETGERVGFVKTTCMSDESYAVSFGTDEFAEFRYQKRYSGKYYRDLGFDGYVDERRERDEKPEDIDAFNRQLWATATGDLRGSYRTQEGEYIADYELKAKHAPDDKTVRKDLKKYRTMISKNVQEALAYYSSEHPHVDFSEVDNEIRGQGFGTAMYVYAAKRLAVENRVLRGSGLQSPEAEALWNRISNNASENVVPVELTRYGNTDTYMTLDFRKTR